MAFARRLDSGRVSPYPHLRMARADGLQTGEWRYAGKSAVRMYSSFFYWLLREPFPIRQLGDQIARVILEAFGTMVVAAIVQGAMFGWLAGWYGAKFSVIYWSGAAGIFLILSESTTMVGAMIFAARIGTGFTVEIGAMQMTSLLDVLRLMAVEPTQQIVIPRVLAAILCLPLLKALTDAVAIVAAMIFGFAFFDISVPIFLQHAFSILTPRILTTSYIRCAIMAFFVGMNACGLGFYFQGGAVELGKTTTKSIVINLIVVIIVDTTYGILDSMLGWSVV